MIGYLRHSPSGCYWYRIKQPMDMLNKNGIMTHMIELDKDVDDSFRAMQFYGAYPFSMERIFQYLRSEGKKIIYDSDDALDLIDTSNPFYYSIKKDIGSAEQNIQNADIITVSTNGMREYMSKKTTKPIVVIPNCYTPSEWIFERPKKKGIRIGFAGSATHVIDLINIIPVIKKLQEKYDIAFIIMGFGKSEYSQWYKEFRYMAAPEAHSQLALLDKLLSSIKFEWVSYVDYTHYPVVLTNMALDIGLCPLTDTPFNRCRSACKAMEYTLSGALALASDMPGYRDDLSSVLIKDNEWEEAITYYIENPLLREEERAHHLNWLQENRNIQTQLEPLKSVYL